MSRFLLTSLVVLVSLVLSACVYNRSAPAGSPLPRDVIVVVGQGEVMGKPDVARLQLGVEARAPDAASAVAAINERAASMIEVLKGLGIKAEDLQTRDFNIHSEGVEGEPAPVEEPVSPSTNATTSVARPAGKPAPVASSERAVVEPGPLPGKRPVTSFIYVASNTVHVTVRDLARLGEVLSRAVEAGANSAWGISFEIDDDAPLVEKARAEAIDDARAQATDLAKLAGVTLGRVVSITDASGGGGPTPPMASGYAMMEMRGVPTQSGQLAVRRQVQVVFAIETDK